MGASIQALLRRLYLTDFGFGSGDVSALVLQSEGKLVAAGTSGVASALARYNPDGSLDETFGSGGA